MHLLDLLSTNPKKVETGLNLIAFATIIFYELDYSLYTLLQASRRVWRLGQIQPVKVVFPIYRNTLEEQAFYLMADKMAASRLLYGDNAAGVFAGGTNELGGSILAELSRRITRGQMIQSNGIQSLLTTNHSQTSDWAAIATPMIPANANGNGHDHQETEPIYSPINAGYATLFVTPNPRERQQRDAGQISLFG